VLNQLECWVLSCALLEHTETEAMARVQHTLDGQPGSLPDIRADVGGITFVMAPPGAPRGKHLLIRCDTEGEVWISIRPERASSD